MANSVSLFALNDIKIIIVKVRTPVTYYIANNNSQITNDLEEEMKKLITEHYGNTDSDTSKAFTEGMDYVQEEVGYLPYSSVTCTSTFTWRVISCFFQNLF